MESDQSWFEERNSVDTCLDGLGSWLQVNAHSTDFVSQVQNL